jgi:hypothetical protein
MFRFLLSNNQATIKSEEEFYVMKLKSAKRRIAFSSKFFFIVA